MIDRLKPYPMMKDSGVPWLGQVPEHWEVASREPCILPHEVIGTRPRIQKKS